MTPFGRVRSPAGESWFGPMVRSIVRFGYGQPRVSLLNATNLAPWDSSRGS